MPRLIAAERFLADVRSHAASGDGDGDGDQQYHIIMQAAKV